MATAWMVLALGDDREHAGNDGYDDDPAQHYSWDSTVQNSARLAVGDVIALWDKAGLIGLSVIEAIDTDNAEKPLYSCPQCHLAGGLKRRLQVKPVFRCSKCKHEFDDPIQKIQPVTTYRSRHGARWVGARGLLSADEVRNLCDSPKSQLSMRAAQWEKLRDALKASSRPDIAARVKPDGQPRQLRQRRGTLASGHRIGQTRQRNGQQGFRSRLMEVQGTNCAFTGPTPAGALDAAHLYSYADNSEHHEYGGLLLRSDIHRLFDSGNIAVNPDTDTLDVAGLDNYPLYAGLQGAPVFTELHDEHRVWLDAHWIEHRGRTCVPPENGCA
ncbi:HNH endonuclease signature motif containing protein [Streptomyces longispororuber]|uniref:HNH endonuclease signature motif containing protein n=1 Tax=Streptomyces longispororuber TaxID=68230 RepID=UPI003703157A